MGLLRRLIGQPELPAVDSLDLVRVGPIEGTNVSLWNPGGQIDTWWAENIHNTGLFFTPSLLEKVWTVNRCLQLNSQQISEMELKFFGPPSATPPQWLSNPDPNWYPNGIQDALFAAVWDFYGHGDAFLYVTSRYADLMPRTWTVIPASTVTVEDNDGSRRFKVGETIVRNPDNVVQISRNPRAGSLRGTSAIASYAGTAWNTIAGVTTTNEVLNNLPPAVLKSSRKLTKEQARELQEQYARRAASRARGVPPVLPPEIDLAATNLGFSPKDLMLLESQEWDARALASAFGVPASLLNMAVSGGLTYQNPAMLGEQWWRFELLNTAGRITKALSSRMLPTGQKVLADASATFTPLDTPEEGADEAMTAPSPNNNGSTSTPPQPMPMARPLSAVRGG